MSQLAYDQDSDSLDLKAQWVDSMYRAMTPDERIGQLIMIRAHSDLGSDHIASVMYDIEKFHVGGLCFFQGTPKKQVELTNQFQKESRIPLLIATDAEWGPGMRLKEDAMSYPRQLMLGAISDNRLIYQMGQQIAEQLKTLGVHMNFAPVADINNNPANPVIHNRSFGEDKFEVTAKAYQYVEGMQDNGVLACAKHFPGHGDTDVDSHLDLPRVSHDILRLDSLELYPFRVLVDKGVSSVMIAHMEMPALDPEPHTPATLSRPITTGILREKMGFNGLVITDAMEMQGVLKHYSTAEATVRAVVAGADIILLPVSTAVAFKAVQKALRDGEITENKIEGSVRRILAAKYDAGLSNYMPADTSRLKEKLFKPEYKALNHMLIRESLTLARNQQRIVPVVDIADKNIACLSISRGETPVFSERLRDYIPDADFFNVTQQELAAGADEWIDILRSKHLVVVSLHDLSIRKSSGFGILSSTVEFLKRLEDSTKLILAVFGTPYTLGNFPWAGHILLAFQDTEDTQDLAAQGLMGVFPLQGHMPVSVGKEFPIHSGERASGLLRLGFGIPEEVGISSVGLSFIDSLANDLIKKKAAPGCQVLIARKGLIVYEKSFGFHRYKKKDSVRLTDLYDLASITKIASATIAVMKLAGEGKVNVDNTLGYYLPRLEGTDKASLVIRDILAHRAGLYPWIPFYRFTLSDDKQPHPLSQFYQEEKDMLFSIKVAENMYLRNDYIPQIWDSLNYSKLEPPGHYQYSDLGFYLLADLVHEVSGDSLHHYVEKNFYKPMNLKKLGYLPLQRFPKDEITPTEEDAYFRFQTLQGYVHDMGAAMMGGVSGHAGLFSNARDLAVLMQLLLNKGHYGGRQYITTKTVLDFTRRVEGSTRRATGFDMKDLDTGNSQPVADEASVLTYGHLGFTGTCVWVDPKEDLIYVFLSNRTFPQMENNLLGKLDYRQRIQALIYHSLMNI